MQDLYLENLKHFLGKLKRQTYEGNYKVNGLNAQYCNNVYSTHIDQ